jgi:hypothetical protein
LAKAELSPEEFNDLRNRALTIGFYYSGISMEGGRVFSHPLIFSPRVPAGKDIAASSETMVESRGFF